MDNLNQRSETLVEIFKDYAKKDDTILEIGCADGRNLRYLENAGYKNVEGIDKLHGTAIEDVPFKEYDIIFTMSTLFLLPKESEWVFEKIADMAQKYIITLEGETTKTDIHLIGRDYTKVFAPFGYVEVEHQTPIFNKYGHLRVLKKVWKK